MRTAFYIAALLGRAVGHPGAGGGKGKNTLDLKILTFKELSHTENIRKDQPTPAPCRTPAYLKRISVLCVWWDASGSY